MPQINAQPPRRTTVWQRYGLSIVLGSAFVLSWGGQAVAEWFVVAQEAEQHGSQPTISDYLWNFAQSTLENWQSEFLQLLTFVVLTVFLIHQGSPESRDSDEVTEAALERIEAKLDALQQAQDRGPSDSAQATSALHGAQPSGGQTA